MLFRLAVGFLLLDLVGRAVATPGFFHKRGLGARLQPAPDQPPLLGIRDTTSFSFQTLTTVVSVPVVISDDSKKHVLPLPLPTTSPSHSGGPHPTEPRLLPTIPKPSRLPHTTEPRLLPTVPKPSRLPKPTEQPPLSLTAHTTSHLPQVTEEPSSTNHPISHIPPDVHSQSLTAHQSSHLPPFLLLPTHQHTTPTTKPPGLRITRTDGTIVPTKHLHETTPSPKETATTRKTEEKQDHKEDKNHQDEHHKDDNHKDNHHNDNHKCTFPLICPPVPPVPPIPPIDPFPKDHPKNPKPDPKPDPTTPRPKPVPTTKPTPIPPGKSRNPTLLPTKGLKTTPVPIPTKKPNPTLPTLPPKSNPNKPKPSNCLTSYYASLPGLGRRRRDLSCTTPLLIKPKYSASKAAKEALGLRLIGLLGVDNVEAVTTEQRGIIFWKAIMNIKQKAQLKLEPIIESIVSDAQVPVDMGDGGDQPPVKGKIPVQRRDSPENTAIHGITKRETSWVHQSFPASDWVGVPPPPNEEWSLREISRPPKVKFNTWKDYLYHESAGNGVWVYIQDTGLNLQNAEIRRLEHTPEWIFVDDIPGQSVNHPATDYYDYHNHGTCMLDLAVGKRDGIARNAQAVVVKYKFQRVPKKPDGQTSDWHPYYRQRLSDYIQALEVIWSHIKGREGEEGFANAVINQSQGIFTKHLENDADYGNLRAWIEELLVKVMDLGAIVLTSAGNGGDQAERQAKWPTLLSSHDVPVIVVGASDHTGIIAGNSDQGDMITVYAPGGPVLCAYGWRSQPGEDVPNFKNGDGTSEACAITSGLVAYYLALPNYPGDKRKPNPFAEHSPPKGLQKLKDKVLGPLPERPKGIERQREMMRLLQELAYPRLKGGPKIIYNGAPADKMKNSKECPVPAASRLARRAGAQGCEASSLRCTKNTLTVPKSSAVAMIDSFCKGHDGNMLSSRKGENYYETTSGTGVSGLRIRHRSPPTSFITASVKWDNSPGCDKIQFKSNIDVCRTGMQAAVDTCQGDGYSGGAATMWVIPLIPLLRVS
ncbi:hypothetical protein K440DRAFT_642250 [Wilcoxina mikolae CBS 423.85]|nr:hypothetical protein K440DRAFT_642250 [Wilcoxina mikolae CBS 423.85]